MTETAALGTFYRATPGRQGDVMPTEMLWVEYNRFTIGGATTEPGTEELPYANGLVAATADPLGGAVILTGLADGQVRVTAELGPPDSLDANEWEDVAEIGIEWPGGQPRVIGADVVPPSFIVFGDEQPSGPYRLLVAGRNRDAGESRAEGEPIEEYLIFMRPGRPAEPDRVRKATSKLGEFWRADRPTGRGR